MANNIKDSVLPNINLRVFRREKTDMSLIYNNSELLSLSSGFDIIPSVYIGNKKLEAYIEKVRAKDSSENDICIFIPYKENGLNDEERYELQKYWDRSQYGVTMYAPVNILKNKLAGMDIDFDATASDFSELKLILLPIKKRVVDFIDYKDKAYK